VAGVPCGTYSHRPRERPARGIHIFGEVDEMPHPGPNRLSHGSARGRLEDLPARRGHGPHMGHVAVVTWAAQDWVGLW
jgi:hypothetical protein